MRRKAGLEVAEESLALWDALPDAVGETLTLDDLGWPAEVEDGSK